MHGKLNVFVISCLYTGEVKTLTLALHGLDVFIFNVKFHNAVVVLYTFPTLIVTIELPDGSANTIYRDLMSILEKYNVPLGKVIGICADGASTMQGIYQGVCLRLARHIRALRQEVCEEITSRDMTRTSDTFHRNRGVFTIHCVCHRLALIVTDAVKGTKTFDAVIPEECLECLRTIHEYFSKSTRRKKKLREYLEQKNATIRVNQRLTARQNRRLLEREVRNPVDALENTLKVLEEQHKLPRRIVMTRWLSSVDAIKVLVTSRTTYQDFFQHETTQKGEEIFEWLHDNTVFGWYYCLIDVIPVLTCLNILFQSSLPVPHLLYPRIQLAKSTLINMVGTEGTGGTRTELLSKDMVDQETKFGAYANKYLELESYTFTERELKELKQGWHNLYSHCLREIDRRFPPGNMTTFQLLQVLDPCIVHGTMRRQRIGTKDLTAAIADLLSVFEVPFHTAFRYSEVCADIWELQVQRYARQPFDHTVVYSFYKTLLQMPDIAPWAFACLFLLIFPTGNACAERGFSAMGATHTKERQEMTNEQVWAHMVIQYNGPELDEYTKILDVESRVPNWWGHVSHSNYND